MPQRAPRPRWHETDGGQRHREEVVGQGPTPRSGRAGVATAARCGARRRERARPPRITKSPRRSESRGACAKEADAPAAARSARRSIRRRRRRCMSPSPLESGSTRAWPRPSCRRAPRRSRGLADLVPRSPRVAEEQDRAPDARAPEVRNDRRRAAAELLCKTKSAARPARSVSTAARRDGAPADASGAAISGGALAGPRAKPGDPIHHRSRRKRAGKALALGSAPNFRRRARRRRPREGLGRPDSGRGPRARRRPAAPSRESRPPAVRTDSRTGVTESAFGLVEDGRVGAGQPLDRRHARRKHPDRGEAPGRH